MRTPARDRTSSIQTTSQQMLRQITRSPYGMTGALVGGTLGLLVERSLRR